MNIQTVSQNLRNTIAAKEVAYNEWRREQSTVGDFVCKMIDLNINELKKILADVEQCCTQANEQSWRDNPDRMGGQITEEDIGFKPDGAW